MSTQKRPVMEALRQKKNVMLAVMLRDMRSRYFNHGLGFLMVPLWPLVHMMILLTIYNLFGRRTPYGSSLNIFFATGLVPTLTFMYVSRFMAVSLMHNVSMLAFPVIKVLDIVMARASLEFLASSVTVSLLFLILVALGDDPFPTDTAEAVSAYVTALVTAIGMGTLVSVIVMFFRGFITIYFLSMILVYLGSGILFVPSALPDSIAIPLSYNPILQCVEWMRTAYFPGYSSRLLDKTYAVMVAGALVCIGLSAERLLRRQVLD